MNLYTKDIKWFKRWYPDRYQEAIREAVRDHILYKDAFGKEADVE